MSLIVQVNSASSGSAQQPQTQQQQPLTSTVVAASTAAPTAVVVSAAHQQPQNIQPLQHTGASLATVAAAAAALEQQQQNNVVATHVAVHGHGGHRAHQQQAATMAGSAVTAHRISTMSPAHIVTHHPPPLRMVHLPNHHPGAMALANGTTVNLPQNPAPGVVPMRHALPQNPVSRSSAAAVAQQQLQLPRSPVRQVAHLPNMPLQRSTLMQQQQQPQQQRPPQQLQQPQVRQIMVNHHGHPHSRGAPMSMLPQAPTPGLMPSAIPVNLAHPSGNLVPLPPTQQPQQQQQTVVHRHHPHPHQQHQHHSPTAANILPPTVLNRQMFSRSGFAAHHLETATNDADRLRSRLEASPQSMLRGSAAGGGRSVLPSSRQQQRDRRSLPCQLALQDHNYVTRPPPTPPPPPSPPPILRDVLEKQRGTTVLHPNDPSFNAALRGLTPELPVTARGRYYSPQQPQQASPAGLVAAVTGPPGSNATAGEPIGTSVLPNRVQANLNSIEEAGVGPMVPLVEDDNSQGSNGSSTADGGEETETAPEGEGGEDDSITRCICDFLHDDGYMICCDKCLVWQHVVCMGLDKNNIPDEYLCEVCKPRPIDRKRAKNLQSRRRPEIFNNSSSSDGEPSSSSMHRKKNRKPGTGNSNHPGPGGGKKTLDRKADQLNQMNRKGAKVKKGGSLIDPTKIGKKAYRKRKPSDANSSAAGTHHPKIKVSPKKSATARRKSQLNDSDLDEDSEDADENSHLEPVVEASQNSRSWIDQYEEAVTNHYSPELRARLAGNRLSGVGSDLRASVLGGPTRCNVSLKGNGVKILTAGNNIGSNTPIIECKGKVMLASQFRASPAAAGNSSSNKSNRLGMPPPYVFFYQLGDVLEICLDGKTYGNDWRFCRRSAAFNAELRHVIDKGSLHLFIVAIKNIDKNQEILLPPELDPESMRSPLPSINADLREIKKPVNGLLSSPEDTPLREKTVKRPKKKVKVVLKPMKKATIRRNPAVKIKEIKEEDADVKVDVKPMTTTTTTTTTLNGGKIKQEVDDDDDEEEEHDDLDDEDVKPPTSPSKNSGPQPAGKTSPGKMGLPDSSGLIVGVNTINYDASSALKNKSRSREERKMDMIMKAIEAMEKADQRKKDHHSDSTSSTAEKPPSKRRRSSSSYKNNATSNADSNLDASSADESRPEPKRTRKKGTAAGGAGAGGRKSSGPSTPQRRRSRVMSGGSASNLSADETLTSPDYSATPTSNGPFRFPKTKKSLMSDWLQESETGSTTSLAVMAEDDDVSANYLRGSRSPPIGIATHLLRSTAPQSPVKNVCSAKKRWLRQAISEDHTDEVMIPINGCASPSSAADSPIMNSHPGSAVSSAGSVMDMVTPLKKRRLANYREDQLEQQDHELSNVKVPNGLKKKLLQNLVLEAVLDKAMEDMLATPATAATAAAEEPKTQQQQETPQPPRLLSEQREKAAAAPVEEDTTEETVPAISETGPAAGIKTPEPSSAFKSFFKSNVSIEALEAEIAASKKQREIIAEPAAETTTTEEPPPEETTETSEPVAVVAEAPASSIIHPGEINKQLDELNAEMAAAAAAAEEASRRKTTAEVVSRDEAAAEVAPVEEAPTEQPEAQQTSAAEEKPVKKKRLSLADYKLRRGTSSTTPTSTEQPPMMSSSFVSCEQQQQPLRPPLSLPPALATAPASALRVGGGGSSSNLEDQDGPGTPTQDEELGGTPVTTLPTLNSVPLFAKLDKLELAQQEIKQKVQNPIVPIVEPKREDLTLRLQKEFGLMVGDDTNEEEDSSNSSSNNDSSSKHNNMDMDDGDATPEEDSHSPKNNPPMAAGTQCFLPSQIPSYPITNYQQAPLQQPPTSKLYSLPPPAVVASTAATSTAAASSNLPPPPSMNFRPNLNFPPPPPPTSTSAASRQPRIEDQQQQVLPPPPPAPLPALKANGPSLSSSRRSGPASKDGYYSRSSPGGGRGYYTSNSHHRDSRRDSSSHSHRDGRDRERDIRDRDIRDRDRERDRDYRDGGGIPSSSGGSGGTSHDRGGGRDHRGGGGDRSGSGGSRDRQRNSLHSRSSSYY